MTNPLQKIITEHIHNNGAISVAEYMRLCLSHPEHGYYNTRDPFGAEGDFTTAPEISQMFGEMIGAWIADSWMKMGALNKFYLVECGPGRGTLMHDILRATKNIEGFHQAVEIYLMEMSPVLKEKQHETLKEWCDAGISVTWCVDLKTLPDDAPVIFIGNEFLDALPVHQYTYTDAGWVENFIETDGNTPFRYCQKSIENDENKAFPTMMFPPKVGEQMELSCDQIEFVTEVKNIIKKQGGIALFVDYGFTIPVYGTTLQAVVKHQYRNIFDTPGECDLTAHVNFAHLSEVILQNDMTLYGPVSQRNFLTRLGIEVRAGHLNKNASGQQAQDIQTALSRLIGTDTKEGKTGGEMGELFKVIAFTSNPDLNLEGFS